MSPRVLLCGRPDLLRKPGGDTAQILALKQGLGPRARLCLDLRPNLHGVDLVHVHNLSRPVEPYLQAEAAWAARVPLVLTPIFQDLRRYNREGRFGLGQLAFAALGHDDERLEDARAVANLVRSGASAPTAHPGICLSLLGHALLGRGRSAYTLMRRLLERSDAVVFNSELEAEAVAQVLGLTVDPLRYAIAPVGIESDLFIAPDPTLFRRRFGVERFVLSVGRIEDLKNQLSLIRAMRGIDLPLVLAGSENPRHRGFARAVRRAVARLPGARLVGPLPRPLLASAMSAAAVHVLPSWFETAGLVSLEAAAAGCPVVSTCEGYARAYLGDEVEYCDPADPLSIRRAIGRALRRGPSAPLRAQVHAELTWAATIRATGAIYDRVMAA